MNNKTEGAFPEITVLDNYTVLTKKNWQLLGLQMATYFNEQYC